MSAPIILPFEAEGDPDATPLKAWQLKRDLAIVAAANSGASAELLGEVFNLTPRRINKIIERTRLRYARTAPDNRTARLPENPRRFVA